MSRLTDLRSGNCLTDDARPKSIEPVLTFNAGLTQRAHINQCSKVPTIRPQASSAREASSTSSRHKFRNPC